MNTPSGCWMTDEDWFNRGKADAWAKRPKASSAQDSRLASMYDLGYSEGEIICSPTDRVGQFFSELERDND
jgi:hypothetical protein